MVKKYHRYQRWRKGDVYGLVEDEESHSCLGFLSGNTGFNKKARPNMLFYFAFLSFVYFTLIYFFSSSTFSFLYSFRVEDGRTFPEANVNVSFCSFVPNGTLCCDRSSTRSDICIMKGDVRTQSATSSVFLYRSGGSNDFVLGDDDSGVLQHEKIKPYTRKWEQIMDTVTQLDLFVKKANLGTGHLCDVQHDVPAVFFSTSGYTGNLYHEFNDGILPLYITSQHLNKKVVFVNLDYHNWWIMKYGDIVSQLTDYPVINFSGDNRTHCFPEAIVGLRIHDELSIDPSLMEGNKTIRDFRSLLDQAYGPRIRGLTRDEEREAQLKREKLGAPSPSLIAEEMSAEKMLDPKKKPKLVIISRSGGSREVTNEGSMVKLAEEIGFSVEVVKPVRTSELARIYRALNSSDVMIGVHGAALTHFLYMRPGCVFIQIIPLGTDWAAETYFGEASVRFGLRYIGYKILPKESSLYDQYEEDDPVLTDPDSINLKGWEITKQVYLDHQNVRLNLARFQKRLLRAYYYTIAKKKGHTRRFQYQLQ